MSTPCSISSLGPADHSSLRAIRRPSVASTIVLLNHKLLRNFDVPDTAEYKGISASVSLGKLYLTSNSERRARSASTSRPTRSTGDATMKAAMRIVRRSRRTARRSMFLCGTAIAGGSIDAATGDVKAKIKTEHGQNYTDHPIGGIGPHNTWMNPRWLARVHVSADCAVDLHRRYTDQSGYRQSRSVRQRHSALCCK